MDRIKSPAQQPVRFSYRWAGLIGFICLFLAILAYKVVDAGWLQPKPALELNNQPVLLFFNRHKGCECALVVYEAADGQISSWSDVARHGVPVISIDMDHRGDLAAHYRVFRAPTLILLDHNGAIVFKQVDVVTDFEPLDLSLFETKIEELLNGN